MDQGESAKRERLSSGTNRAADFMPVSERTFVNRDRASNGGFMDLSRLSASDLEAQARSVELQIKRLDHRPRPTPSERQLSIELKRMRLSLKDRLASAK